MSHKVSQPIAGRIKHNLCDSGGAGLLEDVPGFLPTWPHVPFRFADFAFYPCAVINHSCECNSTQSPLSSASKPSNLGVAGDLTQLVVLNSLPNIVPTCEVGTTMFILLIKKVKFREANSVHRK